MTKKKLTAKHKRAMQTAKKLAQKWNAIENGEDGVYDEIIIEPFHRIGIARIPQNYVIFKETIYNGEVTRHEFYGYYSSLQNALQAMSQIIFEQTTSKKIKKGAIGISDLAEQIRKHNKELEHYFLRAPVLKRLEKLEGD